MKSTGSSAQGRTVLLNGERCRGLRHQRGLNRERLAEALSGRDALSVATIKRAERGQPVYLASAAALARVLGVELTELVTKQKPAPMRVAEQPAARGCIVVRPLTLIDDSPQARGFAEGLVADLLHQIASALPIAGSYCAPETTRREAGQYSLEGSLRVQSERLRLVVQLLDGADGVARWSRSYDASFANLLDLQTKLANDIASRIVATWIDLEGRRLVGRDPASLNAWALSVRSVWHFQRSGASELETACALARGAISREPLLALPRYVLVMAQEHALLNQWARDAAETCAEMCRASDDFERELPGDSVMYLATAYSCLARGQRDEALQRLEAALARDPHSARAHCLHGQVLAMAGRSSDALAALDQARSLSPLDPTHWTVLMGTALAHFAGGQYDSALSWARRTALERPGIPFVHAVVAAANAQLGDVSGARAAIDVLRARDVTLSLERMSVPMRSTERSIAERFIDALRIAGLPDERRDRARGRRA